MPFELEKKIIIAILLGLCLLFGGAVVFYFIERNSARNNIKESSVNKQVEPPALNSTDEEEKNLPVENDKTVKILFGGDIMLDRYIRTVIELRSFDYIIEDIKPLLNEADFVVANLEGSITGNQSVSVGSGSDERNNFVFTFPKNVIPDLYKNNISVVNIGNNHILNFGHDGLEQTREALKKAGIKYFGDPADPEYRRYIKKHNGIDIGFVCYNQFTEDGYQEALDDLSAIENEADAVIVYAHWGTEYETRSNRTQREYARTFIDKGADLIIGSHPHVVQEVETYKNKTIFYSLGNFIFDQYFSEETQEGLLVQAIIRKKGEDFSIITNEIPIQLNNSGKTLRGYSQAGYY
ncbi:MAG: CapA family protein [Patescibacteria group bacterium]|nr:CapA family protein [Patescibacteria group bacterium]